MPTRATGRRPNRRQLDRSALYTAPATLELHGTIVSTGQTLVQVGVLGEHAFVTAQGDTPLVNTITLRGIIDGVFQTLPCVEVANLGSTGLGIASTLKFEGELDELAPFECAIPSNVGLFGNGLGGRPIGTVAASEAGSTLVGGYLRLTNVQDLTTVLPALIWVTAAESLDTQFARIQTNDSGASPFTIDGVPAFNLTGAGSLTSATDDSGGAIMLDFGSGVAPGGVLTFAAWQASVRGASGQWLAPFSVAIT